MSGGSLEIDWLYTYRSDDSGDDRRDKVGLLANDNGRLESSLNRCGTRDGNDGGSGDHDGGLSDDGGLDGDLCGNGNFLGDGNRLDLRDLSLTGERKL